MGESVGLELIHEDKISDILLRLQLTPMEQGYVVIDSTKDINYGLAIHFTEKPLGKKFTTCSSYFIHVGKHPWHGVSLRFCRHSYSSFNLAPDERTKYKIDHLRIRCWGDTRKTILLNKIPKSKIIWTVEEIIKKYNRLVTLHNLMDNPRLDWEEFSSDVIGWTGEYDFEKEAIPCP